MPSEIRNGRAVLSSRDFWVAVAISGIAVSLIVVPLRYFGAVPSADAPAAQPASAPAREIPPAPEESLADDEDAEPGHADAAMSQPAILTPELQTPTDSSIFVPARSELPETPAGPDIAPPPVAPPIPDEKPNSIHDRRSHALERGATPLTETAVDLGLAWLAQHATPDGEWDAIQFGDQCPQSEPCAQPAVRRIDDSIRPGLTGLCLLAFVGGGHTPPTEGDSAEPHPTSAESLRADFVSLTVSAKNALLRLQRPDGGFGADDAMAGYNDVLATLALAEYMAQTRDESLRGPLSRAVGRIVLSQQELGGWDYRPAPETDRNDTSITAWAIQALQAAEAAGVESPRDALLRASIHLARSAEPDGRVWYADSGEGVKVDADLKTRFRYGPAMIACALVCESLLGWRGDSPMLRLQLARLEQDLPSETRARGKDPSQLHSEYYWYYGTVATFHLGGDRWERWNGHLRDALLPLQDRAMDGKGRRKHSYGSWPAYGRNWGKWGRLGGRVYSTAIAVLTLETYYRHTPAFLRQSAITGQDWVRFVTRAERRERRFAIRALRELRFELGEPALVELLRDDDAEIAQLAAEALISIGSPLGIELLRKHVATLPPWARPRAEKLIAKAEELRALPPAQGVIQEMDGALNIAIIDLPRAYIGMVVGLRDGSKTAGDFRVVGRASGSRRVVAEWRGTGREKPAPGDEVISRE